MSAPPPRPNAPPPPRPNAPLLTAGGGISPRPSAPPPRPNGDLGPSRAPSSQEIPGPPRGVPPGPPRGAPPGPPRGAPSGPPPGAPPGPPPGAPPGPPPGAPPGPPPGAPRPPPGNPSSTSPLKLGYPGPPPGAPLGPPPGEPPRPPKEPPPSATGQGLTAAAVQVVKDAESEAAALAKLLKRGRFNIKLLEARGLKKKGGTDNKFNADPYVKIKIGSHPLSAKEVKSKTLKKCTSTVIFHEEVLHFDLIDPHALIADGDVPLKIEVYDENLLSDELLGEVSLSALRYFDGKVHTEVLPLRLSSMAGVPCGELEVEIKMDIALVGMISVILMEGRNLKSMELIGKQDPYCKLAIGNFSKRGKTVQKGGRNPYFGEEELLFWITEDLWVHNMQLSLFDEDIGSDDLIGDAQFSVLHFMAAVGAQEHAIALKNKGQSAGEVVVKIEFFPAGRLTIQCLAGKQLRSVDAIGRQDPYVQFTFEGRATKMIMKTKTDTDGGREPEWENETFTFQVVDQYNILVEVWDEDSVGDDDLIGSASVSLLPVFRYGYIDNWLNLWIKGKFGNKDPAGQLHLIMSFEGPPGIAYPQHQIGMDRFTDKERRTKETALLGPDQQEPSAVEGDRGASDHGSTVSKVNAVSAAAKTKAQVENSGEFSEEEILGAFKFIDLDRNNFVGAAELRHLLICMGELITDEEIDMMIQLCDTDGDGQVSFDEFRRMVIHPDPGSPDFALAPIEDPEGPVDVQLITKEITVEEKSRQAEVKEEKRRLMKRFVEDNTPNLDLLMRISLKFHQMHKDSLDFEDFCMLFEVEPTGEYRRLFALYTEDGQSDEGADMREILLGIVNFMDGTDRNQRVKFCFEIFDDDHNGFITEDELVNILKANHMTTSAQVKKKAQTIMRQADDNGDSKMSLDEFYVIAKKFPNLLFPSHSNVSSQGSPVPGADIIRPFTRTKRQRLASRMRSPDREYASLDRPGGNFSGSSEVELLVKHLAERLNAAQVKIKRLNRLEAALVDFVMEVMDRSVSATTTATTITSMADGGFGSVQLGASSELDTAFARQRRKEQLVKTADGDPISLLSSLRTHLRLQFTTQSEQHNAMSSTIATIKSHTEMQEKDTQEAIHKLEAAGETYRQHIEILLAQVATNESEKRRLAWQYKCCLEQLQVELQRLSATNQKQQQSLLHQQQEVEALKQANESLLKEKKKLSEELSSSRGVSTSPSTGALGLLPANASAGPSNSARSASSSKIGTPAENETLRRAVRDYEVQLSKLTATNEDWKREVHRLQQQLSGYRHNTQSYARLEQEFKKTKALVEELRRRVTDGDAELLRTKGTLKERDALIQQMKDEYNKLFTALQKIKQPHHSPSKTTLSRLASTSKILKITASTPSLRLAHPEEDTPDGFHQSIDLHHSTTLASSKDASVAIESNTLTRNQANENPYLIEHYKSRVEALEAEIEGLQLQIRKMIASEYRYKQKNRLFRVEKTQLVDTCDRLRQELDKCLRCSAKTITKDALKQQQLATSSSLIDFKPSRESQVHHLNALLSRDGAAAGKRNDERRPPSPSSTSSTTVNEVKKLRQRNQFLEERFRCVVAQAAAAVASASEEPTKEGIAANERRSNLSFSARPLESNQQLQPEQHLRDPTHFDFEPKIKDDDDGNENPLQQVRRPSSATMAIHALTESLVDPSGQSSSSSSGLDPRTLHALQQVKTRARVRPQSASASSRSLTGRLGG